MSGRQWTREDGIALAEACGVQLRHPGDGVIFAEFYANTPLFGAEAIRKRWHEIMAESDRVFVSRGITPPSLDPSLKV